MKTILLAGGFGTRLSEETNLRPKPMVMVGDRPILSHIMGLYAKNGFNDFVVAGGYRVDFIKNYFANLPLQLNDYKIDLETGEVDILGNNAPDWKVAVIDTGLHTMTGGRIKRLRDHVGDTFMCTYGDGLSNIDIQALVDFHNSHDKLATVSAVRPPARFGKLVIDGNDQVKEFEEKNPLNEGWINGGFFVLDKGIFDFIDDDSQPFEREPLTRIAEAGQLMAFQHDGFWQPMDTLREKEKLETLWASGNPPWA